LNSAIRKLDNTGSTDRTSASGHPCSSPTHETLWSLCRPTVRRTTNKKGKASPYSIAERGVPELIPVLGSQPAGDVNHKPGGMLLLLSARPAVTPATLKRTATNFPILLLGEQRHDGCEQFA